MRGRIWKCLLALLWLVWTGIVIPVHTPGFVPLMGEDGSPGTAAGAMGGCPLCAITGETSKRLPGHKTPAGCAICDFKAKLSSGTGLIVHLAPLGLLESGAGWAAIETPFVMRMGIRQSRAPPINRAV